MGPGCRKDDRLMGTLCVHVDVVTGLKLLVGFYGFGWYWKGVCVSVVRDDCLSLWVDGV